MPRIVLRLMLICCLILSGIGNAVAAVAMPSMTGEMDHAAMVMPDVEPLPASACAHQTGDSALVATLMEHPTPSAPHPADCDQSCCAQGACTCTCMQLAQAALFYLPMPSRAPARNRVSTFFPAGHATPALPDLIRPPIG